MGKYVTVQDILAEGVPEDVYSEDLIETLIEEWERQVEHTTGQEFTKATDVSYYVDGHGTDTLILPARPLDVQVYPQGQATPIPTETLRIDRDAWTVIWLRGTFAPGKGNHLVRGDFGWEAPPVPLKRAIVRLVVRTLGTLNLMTGDLIDQSGGVRQEKLDQRSVVYTDQYINPEIFQYPDPRAWAVIMSYKRPPDGGAI